MTERSKPRHGNPNLRGSDVCAIMLREYLLSRTWGEELKTSSLRECVIAIAPHAGGSRCHLIKTPFLIMNFIMLLQGNERSRSSLRWQP